MWRLIHRGPVISPRPDINGVDCYVFRRAGTSRPDAVSSLHVVPVAKFWGSK